MNCFTYNHGSLTRAGACKYQRGIFVSGDSLRLFICEADRQVHECRRMDSQDRLIDKRPVIAVARGLKSRTVSNFAQPAQLLLYVGAQSIAMKSLTTLEKLHQIGIYDFTLGVTDVTFTAEKAFELR